MTDHEPRRQLAAAWFARAEEALASAETDARERHYLSCVNRLYYAAFYAVTSVLARDGHDYGKHSAVRAALHRDLIKTGRVPIELGDTYDRLFDARQQADYSLSADFDEEYVATALGDARSFVRARGRLAGL